MTMSIQEVRSKFPQYSDLSDDQLAKALHSKFYSDIPFDKFSSDIGLGKAQPPDIKTEPTRNPGVAGLVNFGAQMAGLGVDTVENAINIGVAGAGRVSGAFGGPTPAPLHGSFGGSESIRRGLRYIADKTGIKHLNPDNPNPQSDSGTLAYDLASRGGGVPGGVIPAAASIIAEKIGGPDWAGVGAMLPGFASQVVGDVTRQARTNFAQNVQQNTDTFKRAGVDGSAGQATQLNFLQGFESLLSKFPGGQGIFRRFAENQQERLGANTRTGVSAEDAGRAIEAGYKDFASRTSAVWKRLDQDLADKVANTRNYNIPPNNTISTLDKLTQVMPGAENTTAALINPKLKAIKENLMADVQNNMGGIPFEAIRNLRSKVGTMLDDSMLAGVTNAELKQLYGALSKDMEVAAKAVGADKEFARQNNYWRSRMDRMEAIDRVIGNTPEETFRRFLPKNPDEATTQRQVMRALKPEERATVTDAVVARLGRARSGVQNDVGDVFSSNTFLTNWNNMSEGAKAQIFPNAEMRANMNAIASVSSNIKTGSQVFANPSGSAGAAAGYGITGGAIGGAVATGSVIPLLTAGGLVTGANISARLLTNPEFVKWLAKAPSAPSGNQAAYLARLGVIFNDAKDDDLRQDISAYVSSVGGK